jgi:hypothetical protein
MKTIRLLICFTLSMAMAAPAFGQKSDWVSSYNTLLGKYVTGGRVKYAEWKANAGDMQALQQVVDGIARESASTDKKQQLAFYCNAYNAWILHETLEKYPTKSVKDALFTFFTSKRITVAGQQTSFKALEDNVIRKLGEPRVHFALNCASRSCPPLSRQAFTAANVDGQFETLAKGYINSDRGVRFNSATKSAELSKIFDWYKDDFQADGGPVAFINKRRSSPLPADAKISYQDYDWGLNEAK